MITTSEAARGKAATFVVLAVLAIGVVCLWNGARRVGYPFPGFLVSDNRIILSIGRHGWSVESAERILFAQVVAIEDRPLATATEIDAYVRTLPVGTPVSYRLRQRADVFNTVIEVKRFGLDDFFALYVTYFITGACFCLAGHRALRRFPNAAASLPFFALCETAGLALATGGDVYGPYWFTQVYFAAHCLTPAMLIHFASNFPEPLSIPASWRRLVIGAVYATMLGIAVLLNRTADEPSLFLPLIYTLYLILANAFLLYLGRLVGSAVVTDLRHSARVALVWFLLSATIPGIIFVVYPVLDKPISPILLVAPLVLFPLGTLAALRSAARIPVVAAPSSAHQRFSFLFLSAVETAFLAGIAVFWLSNSWQQLAADLALNQHQQTLVDRFLAPGAPLEDLGLIDRLVQTRRERTLVGAATAAAAEHDTAAAHAALEQLAKHYREAAERLSMREHRLGELDAGFVISLVFIGIAQAVGFMIAIRRWLIHPVESLAIATNVIATGDLSHRVALEATSEFTLLADAINTMASSLARIQAGVNAEQEARRRTAGEARDAERRRLARELHDGTLQDLGALKLRLEAATRIAGDSPVAPLVGATIDIIVGLQRIIDDFGAPGISPTALRQAVTTYAQGLAEAHGATVDVQLAESAQVPDWAARDVYRIAQEALTNAVRHGTPAHISVELSAASGPTTLRITDDGAGFDMHSVALGTGLRGMQERAAAIGATLEIVSAPHRGTRVSLTLAPTAPRL